MAEGTMIPVTGLWKKKTRDGTVFLSGNLNDGCSIFIFPNDRKENEKHPDYRMYFAKRERQQSADDGGDRRSQRRRDPAPADTGGNDDDVAF